jgi:serine phosphatase RsbU (regulator of sigma subunit)
MSHATTKLNKAQKLPLDRSLLREIDLAQNIQKKLLNAKPLSFPTGQIIGTSIPARVVGGDYYDYVTLPDGRIRMIIGDVMGKGIPAAMLMILTRGAFRSLAMKADGPGETLTLMNQAMIEDLRSLRSFVTLFCADWDPAARKLYVANAGHTPPFYKNNEDEWQRIESKGIMIGGLPNQRYEQSSLLFEEDAFVLFYTDGITESVNPVGERFGIDRLLKQLNESVLSSAEELHDMILNSVTDYTYDDLQTDDLTLLVLKISR